LITAPDTPLVRALRPSPNFGARNGVASPSILLLHYTGVATAEKAIDWLSRPESRVSCHYVIDEAGVITQMVAEEMRAWHAGLGAWAGDTDINSSSIGIEIHNPGHDLGYTEFPPVQLQAVIALSRDIVARYPISAERVLGHSDVAPLRKKDPGEKFPWHRLAAAGLGHWVAPAPVDAADRGVGPGEHGPLVAEVQTMLRNYGYGIEPSGQFDEITAQVLIAFQRHFRPARVDGRIDQSTITTLQSLSAALPKDRLSS
jgi:N-acetylmuramoyl-L-alanine amidase